MRLIAVFVLGMLAGCEPEPAFPLVCGDNPDRPWPPYMKSYPRDEALALIQRARDMGFTCTSVADCGGSTVADIRVGPPIETENSTLCMADMMFPIETLNDTVENKL